MSRWSATCLSVFIAAAGVACGGGDRSVESGPLDREPAARDSRDRDELEAACDEGERRACTELGLRLYEAPDGTDDALFAFELLAESCLADDGEACSGLGVLYFEGFGVEADHLMATASWQRACELDSGSGCAYLGVSHLFGLGTARDSLAAALAWERSCDLGEGEGCRFAGDLFIQDGPLRDAPRAFSLWEQACALGDAEGCLSLARQAYTGRLRPVDRTLALALFDVACELGGASGCISAGNMVRYGEGVSPDPDVALGYYEVACELGDLNGCDLEARVVEWRHCQAAGGPDCDGPLDRRDLLECTSESGFGVVTLTPDQYARRHGVGVTELLYLASSIEMPVEVCRLDGELEFLMNLRCADGSSPYYSRDHAHGSRAGSVGSGGRCGRIIDLYRVPCPEGSYELYMDMYICPSAVPETEL